MKAHAASHPAQTKSWIQSFSGQAIDPRAIDSSKVSIEDVAHALAMKCRYSGHCTHFYSVAEHCVRGSHIVEPEFALAFLLHEMDEVFLPDIAQPIKGDVFFNLHDGEMVPWKVLCQMHETAILRALKLDILLVKTHSAEVKKADLQMLAWEARDLMGNPPQDWGLVEAPPENSPAIHPWSPTYAEFRFLDAWERLRGGGTHERHCKVRG